MANKSQPDVTMTPAAARAFWKSFWHSFWRSLLQNFRGSQIRWVRVALIICAIAIFAKLISYSSAPSKPLNHTPAQAVEAMNKLFVDHPGRDMIVFITTKILREYDQPLTGNNYYHLADIVQTMHDDNVSVSQMDLLSCTDEIGLHNIKNLKMEQAIGFCTTFLSTQ